MELSGACALVTGAARRVGRAIALGLAEAGCDLVLHYGSSTAEAVAAAEEARSRGARVVTVGADLADPGAPARLVAAAGSLSPVRVLVNSAAVFPDDDLAGVTPEQWDGTMAVNLRAPVLLS